MTQILTLLNGAFEQEHKQADGLGVGESSSACFDKSDTKI